MQTTAAVNNKQTMQNIFDRHLEIAKGYEADAMCIISECDESVVFAYPTSLLEDNFFHAEVELDTIKKLTKSNDMTNNFALAVSNEISKSENNGKECITVYIVLHEFEQGIDEELSKTTLKAYFIDAEAESEEEVLAGLGTIH